MVKTLLIHFHPWQHTPLTRSISLGWCPMIKPLASYQSHGKQTPPTSTLLMRIPTTMLHNLPCLSGDCQHQWFKTRAHSPSKKSHSMLEAVSMKTVGPLSVNSTFHTMMALGHGLGRKSPPRTAVWITLGLMMAIIQSKSLSLMKNVTSRL